MILNSPTISGSLTVTGNIIASGSITLSGSVASASYAATASFVALAQSASNATNAISASYANAFTVAGTLTAQTLVVQTITSSVDYVTGSTRFGSLSSDTMQVTGSIYVSGSGRFTNTLYYSGSSQILDASNGNTGYLYQSLTNASGGAYFGLERSTGGGLLNNSTAYATVLGSTTLTPLQFGTNSTIKMTISSSGNVWIGNDSNPYLEIANGGSTDVASGIKWMVGSGRTYYGAIELAASSANNSYLKFSVNSGSTVTEVMRVTGSKVGIGTISPNTTLNAASSGGTGQQFSITDTAATGSGKHWYMQSVVGTLYIGNSTNASGIYAGLTDRLILTNTGNMGVGITNPTDTDGYGGKVLDVNGPGYFRDNSDNTKYVSIGSVSSIGFIEANGTGNYLRFYTGGSGEKMRITTDGYTKMSPTGTYAQSSGYYHECYGGAANGYTLIVTSNVATPLSQYIFDIRFSAATPNNTSARFLHCSDATATRAIIRSNGGLANYQSNNADLSDIRTKKDIISLESYWDKFKALEIVKYKYKDQTHDDFNIGVIAQQVEEVAPEFVDVDGWSKNDIESESPLKSIYTKDLYHATIKVLQEAMAKIEDLQAQITELKNK